MHIIEWVIWAIVCGWTIFSFIAHLGDIFAPNRSAQPQGAAVFWSAKIKRLISGLYVVGMVVALAVTLISDISKLHLLWFVPLWHLFGTQWIGLIYEKVTLRGHRPFSNQTLGNIMPSDAVKVMYETYRDVAKAWRAKGYSDEEARGVAKAWREKGCSDEEAFWISFAWGALYPFFVEEEDAEDVDLEIGKKIRLSDILGTFLTIYREEVNRDMKTEEAPQFLNLLKEKFDEVRNIVYETNPDEIGRELYCFLSDLGADPTTFHAAVATHYIAKGLSERVDDHCDFLELIRDV